MSKVHLKHLCLGSLLTLAVISCNSASDNGAPARDNDKLLIPADLVRPDALDAAEEPTSAIDLSDAPVYGGSTKTVTANVEVSTETTKDGLKFWMTRPDPRRGDFAALSFTVDDLMTNEGYELKIVLRSPYLKDGAQEHIVYQVLMDDKVLLTEDVADSKKFNNINISWKADKSDASFTIRSLAIANCGRSEWGRIASPIIVKSATLEPAFGVEELSVTASSPFTTIN